MSVTLTAIGVLGILTVPVTPGAAADGHGADCRVAVVEGKSRGLKNLDNSGRMRYHSVVRRESLSRRRLRPSGRIAGNGEGAGRSTTAATSAWCRVCAAREERRRRPRVGTLTGGEWCVRRRASRPVVHGVVPSAPCGRRYIHIEHSKLTASLGAGLAREFDPGSGTTLAACLTHASRAGSRFGVGQRRTGE